EVHHPVRGGPGTGGEGGPARRCQGRQHAPHLAVDALVDQPLHVGAVPLPHHVQQLLHAHAIHPHQHKPLRWRTHWLPRSFIHFFVRSDPSPAGPPAPHPVTRSISWRARDASAGRASTSTILPVLPVDPQRV